MSQNLPALTFAQPGLMPALADNVLDGLLQIYDEAFTGLGGAAIRRIKVRKTDFLLKDGMNEEVIPANELVGVFVGANKVNHAVWYEKDYINGQEPEIPDLTWIMPTPDTFPDALPAQFHKKVIKNGQEMWGFQILRRVAFCIVRMINGVPVLDTERPFVMDISSMSLYGKGLPNQNMYKWSGIADVCRSYSNQGIRVTPAMFLTKIILDPNVTVTGVVSFQPQRDPQTNHLKFLDQNSINAVYDVAQRQTTRDMLEIREKLTYKNAAPVAPVFTELYQPPAGQPQAVAPQGMQQPVSTPPVNNVVNVVPASAFQAGFAATGAVTPEEQMRQQPSSIVQQPINVAATTPAGTTTLAPSYLEQAAAILAEQASGQTPQASTPAPQTQAPVQNQFVPTQATTAASAVPSLDPTTEQTVNALLASLS